MFFWDGCGFVICCNRATSTLVDVRYVLFKYIFFLGGMSEVVFVWLFFGQSNVLNELGVGLVPFCPLILVARDFFYVLVNTK